MLNQTYFAKGKLLLFGEYFVLFGSKALAIPTRIGQHLNVQTKRSYDPKLIWESYDVEGEKWFDVEMDLWHFRSQEELDNRTKVAHESLQYLLEQVRRENPHFLREQEQITVKTKLEFPLKWGLGSSSSLIFNVAQWAKVNPFDLGARSFGGSGYDIACASAEGPIVYQKDERPYEREPLCGSATFNPSFSDQLFFVYLGQKAKTSEHLKRIEELEIELDPEILKQVDSLIENVLSCESLSDFESHIREYEQLVETQFEIPRAKNLLFSDYWGAVKSLGAWGGDFVLVSSDKSFDETRKYFNAKGYDTFIPYNELVNNEYKHIQAFTNPTKLGQGVESTFR